MKKIQNHILALTLACIPAISGAQQWRTEKLNRNVVAIPQNTSGTNYLISWRMLDTDDDYTTFDVMKDGEIIRSDINSSTNYLDTKGSSSSSYRIITKQHGEPIDTTEAITPWKDVFMQVHLDRPADGTFHDVSYYYSPNDCSVADVDADGEYEIVVKWNPSAEADNSQGGFTGPTIFDCYKMDGTKLWRIDMGHNIRSGAHYVPFLFYDFDGDGKAEFIVKTAPGTIDGTGRYVSEAATDEKIRQTDNTKEHLNAGGQVMTGPEFLTVFDGMTGQAIHTVYYNPNRGCFVGGAPESRTDIWGDDYGNRSERYLATVAYLDGPQGKASAVMCRGYYTRAYLWAVDFDGKTLSTRWRHASLSKKTVMTTGSDQTKEIREHDQATYPEAEIFTAYGQGNHNLTVGDVDQDGYDEIIYGSAAIDHDGSLLWTTGLCHGDAIHMGDLMPDRPGLEVFQIHEDPPYGMHICDAATGELLIHKKGGGDTARGMVADVMDKRGAEFWYFGDANMYNTDGSIVGGAMSTIFRIYWDGDVYEELLADISRHNQPYLEKYGVGRLLIGNKQVYEHGYNVTCNGTKGTPCLTADLFGDWREEMIFYNNEDKQTLNIFSTSTLTAARVPCLMYDHTYRMAITWQNAGYNQPPHLGYYLPDATQARFTWLDDTRKDQEINLGDSIQPLTMHYVNCTSAAVRKVIRPNGSSYSYLPRQFSFERNAKLCQMTLSGTPTEAGTWQFIIESSNSSNGIATCDTIRVKVTDPTGINEIHNDEAGITHQEAIYDLQGRKVNDITRKGIYIIGKKKIIIK